MNQDILKRSPNHTKIAKTTKFNPVFRGKISLKFVLRGSFCLLLKTFAFLKQSSLFRLEKNQDSFDKKLINDSTKSSEKCNKWQKFYKAQTCSRNAQLAGPIPYVDNIESEQLMYAEKVTLR